MRKLVPIFIEYHLALNAVMSIMLNKRTCPSVAKHENVPQGWSQCGHHTGQLVLIDDLSMLRSVSTCLVSVTMAAMANPQSVEKGKIAAANLSARPGRMITGIYVQNS